MQAQIITDEEFSRKIVQLEQPKSMKKTETYYQSNPGSSRSREGDQRDEGNTRKEQGKRK